MFEQIGHSLGGALAELDALYLTLNLPSNISIKAVTYGTPRVGNRAFATFYDKNVRCASKSHSCAFHTKVHDFTRINNQMGMISR